MKIKKPVLTMVTACLICALILLTFLSRTIMTANQAEVMYVNPEKTNILTSREVAGIAEYETAYDIAYDIPLKILGVFVKQGDEVRAGQKLMEVAFRELALELKKKELIVLQIKNIIENTGITEELQAQLEIAEEEAAIFKEKYPTDGKIYAETAGTVYGINAVKDETTEGNATLLEIFNKDSAANVIFYLSEYDADFFNEGDSVILYYSENRSYGENIESVSVAKNSTVSSKQYILKDNFYKFFVPVQSSYIYHNQQIQLKITNKSPVYDMVVPYEAIHQRQDGTFYVYALKKRNGLFGEEYYPDMADVTVLYENKVSAAVSSINITRLHNIVVWSSDSLLSGSTIRIIN